MKRPIRSSFLILIISFSCLFGFRLMFGYITYPVAGSEVAQVLGGMRDSFSFNAKNYASKKGGSKGGITKNSSGSLVPLGVDQKYEKVGTLSLKSESYESDETKIRKSISEAGALIQFEQSSGLIGKRSLHLAIGVIPEKFDNLISKLRTLGNLTSVRVDKIDKTNEYRMLQAKRNTLETTRKSLESLKGLGKGSIEELIELEEKISQTESQIQDLGVNLGDYDAENEFCTVKCSLLEAVVSSDSGIGFAQRVKVALEWSVGMYLKFIAIALLGTFAIWAALMALLLIRRIFPSLKVAYESRVED